MTVRSLDGSVSAEFVSQHEFGMGGALAGVLKLSIRIGCSRIGCSRIGCCRLVFRCPDSRPTCDR
jgi:hypothetical protein